MRSYFQFWEGLFSGKHFILMINKNTGRLCDGQKPSPDNVWQAEEIYFFLLCDANANSPTWEFTVTCYRKRMFEIFSSTCHTHHLQALCHSGHQQFTKQKVKVWKSVGNWHGMIDINFKQWKMLDFVYAPYSTCFFDSIFLVCRFFIF